MKESIAPGIEVDVEDSVVENLKLDLQREKQRLNTVIPVEIQQAANRLNCAIENQKLTLARVKVLEESIKKLEEL